MKDYRVRYWEQDGQESYLEFDTVEQAQIFYDSLNTWNISYNVL